MEWRPAGLKNPYPDKGDGYQVGNTALEHIAWEAGVNAALEALIANQDETTDCCGYETTIRGIHGRFVFIPDDEVSKEKSMVDRNTTLGHIAGKREPMTCRKTYQLT